MDSMFVTGNHLSQPADKKIYQSKYSDVNELNKDSF